MLLHWNEPVAEPQVSKMSDVLPQQQILHSFRPTPTSQDRWAAENALPTDSPPPPMLPVGIARRTAEAKEVGPSACRSI